MFVKNLNIFADYFVFSQNTCNIANELKQRSAVAKQNIIIAYDIKPAFNAPSRFFDFSEKQTF